MEFDIQDMSAVSYSPTSASFSLKGNDVCNTTRFTVDYYETMWAGSKNILASYSCADNSICVVILKKNQ